MAQDTNEFNESYTQLLEKLEESEPILNWKYSPSQRANLVTPLQIACSMGEIDKVRSLVAGGVGVDLVFSTGSRTPLQLASSSGRSDIVETLLAAGATVNIQNPWGYTALSMAVEGRHVNVVEMLLSADADQEIALATLSDEDRDWLHQLVDKPSVSDDTPKSSSEAEEKQIGDEIQDTAFLSNVSMK